MHVDPNFYRVVAVAQPKFLDELVFVMITLENMKGQQKQQKMMFTDVFVAWDFYRAQESMLKNKVK